LRLRIVAAAAFVAALLLPAVHANGYILLLASQICVYAIMAVGLDLLVGYAGLLSLSQAGFYAIGGYALGIYANKIGPELLIAAPVAIVVTALAGALVGALLARTSGVVFLMVTLAFTELVTAAGTDWSAITNGSNGMTVAPFVLAGHPGIDGRNAAYLLCLVSAAVLCVLVFLVSRSPIGMALRGIRLNETKMRSLGYPVERYKFVAFVIAATLSGCAGVLGVLLNHFISPDDANWVASAAPLIMVLLGGAGTIVGGVLGAVTYVLLQTWVSTITQYWSFVIGLILVIVVLFSRQGMIGIVARLRAKSDG
jgi:branched-chain amino acid transport system permease protein